MLISRLTCIFTILLFQFGSVAQELRSPESIVFDSDRDRYLVSSTLDGDIKSVSSSGDLSSFGVQSKGSHGLVIEGEFVFACYESTVFCYDLDTEELLGTYSIPGARFLNGVCTDGKGYLYLTDFSRRMIYRMQVDKENGEMIDASHWFSSDRILNGIAYDKFRDELLALTWGNDAVILCLDRQTGRLKHRVETGFGNLESIYVDHNGDAYVTAWSPAAILRFDQGVRTAPVSWISAGIHRPTGLIITEEGEAIHLSSDSEKVFGLEKSVSAHGKDLRLNAFPNPVSINSLISYDLRESGYVNIAVYDCQGKLVKNLMHADMDAGSHKFFYERGDYPSGLYFINLQTEEGSESIAVTLVD